VAVTDEPATTSDQPKIDLVRVKRAKIARAASLAQRTGYSLYLIAIIAFFIGFFGGLTPGVVRIIVIAMAIGSVLLAPAIVAGYAVKAAEREDRENGI
jgi:uncharacterized membrane protein (DUF485 family)